MTNPKVFINPKSGSIRVTATVDIVDVDGKVIETIENPKFCGCGNSREKPFCDGSHNVVKRSARNLQAARESGTPCKPFDPNAQQAEEIRQFNLQHMLEAGEKVVGLKIGGALESADNPNGVLIYGYLTDAMQRSGSFDASLFIHPRAEAEVVFKISKEISSVIDISQVHDYVSQVAVGMEIFDYRYGLALIYSNDAIADNAGAAAFAIGPWVDARNDVFENLHANVLADGQVVESQPLTAIRGNPWLAIVELSKVLAANHAKLEAESIVFSGSATKGVHLVAGNNYCLDIKGLGQVDIQVV